MPKVELYFWLEKLAKEESILIYDEKLESDILTLKVLNAKIETQGIEIAYISKVEFLPLILFNRVTVDNLELSEIVKDTINIDVKKIEMEHSILKPLYVDLNISLASGNEKGYIDLDSGLLHIDIKNKKSISILKNILTKSKEGWYYEYKFKK
jgi:hypothetical protein